MLGLIWGASFLSIQFALDTIPVTTSVLHRVLWAMLALWIEVCFRWLTIPHSPHVWLAFLIMGLLNNAIPFSLMTSGQLYIETGLTSILNAMTAIFGVIVAVLFFKDERLSRTRYRSWAWTSWGYICNRDTELCQFRPAEYGQTGGQYRHDVLRSGRRLGASHFD